MNTPIYFKLIFIEGTHVRKKYIDLEFTPRSILINILM